MIDILLYAGVFYLLGLPIVLTLIMAWFRTPLPVHIFKALRKLGWKKWDRNFWPDDHTYRYWLRYQCVEWYSIQFPGWVAHLLNCQLCLSVHISFWVSLLCLLTLGGPLWFLPFTTLGWPALVQLILPTSSKK